MKIESVDLSGDKQRFFIHHLIVSRMQRTKTNAIT